jgi:hypothetical protein
MIKLGRVDGALSTHGRENIYIAFVGKPQALEDSDGDRMIILNWSSGKRAGECELDSSRDRKQWRALRNIVLSLLIP